MNRRTRRHVRMAAVFLAWACIAAAPAPAPIRPGFDSIPVAARAMLHPTTVQLPSFPDDNPALLDPTRWVPSSRDKDRRCALELRTYERGVPVALRDVGQRKSGQSLSARYLCVERGWREARYVGPFYVWDRDNTLIERSYRTTDGARYREDLYQYRENGLVWAYRHRERNEDQTGPSLMLDEYFDPDGKLAGFSVERTGADSLSVRWKRGAIVEDEAFRKWAGDFR